MRVRIIPTLLLPLILAGCGKTTPMQPQAQAPTLTQSSSSTTAAGLNSNTGAVTTAGRTAPGSPGYEQAYVDGKTVTINAIEVPPVAPEKAQADFYEVVYPIGWENMGIGTPQCNPCDHDGNGIDFMDYHDHILDSMPSDPGGNEYRGPWHVYVVVPAYNHDADHDSEINTAYAARIPTKSEAAVNELLGEHLSDGTPVAAKIDTHFYFLCAVVSPHAAH